MLLIKSIKLNNFLSHSDTILELEPNQTIMIDGKSGAGKSSIIEALLWCLYGKSRTIDRNLIKKGKNNAEVIIILKDTSKTSDDMEYRFERSITSKGKRTLKVLEKKETNKSFVPIKATGAKSIQEYIEKEIIHSSYLLFVNSIIYPQSSTESFVDQTASKRKEIILEIANVSDYKRYYEKAKDKVRETEIDKARNDTTKENLKERIESVTKTSEALPELENEKMKLTKNFSEIETKLSAMKKEQSKIEAFNDKVRDKKLQLSDIDLKLENINLDIGTSKTKISEMSDENTKKVLIGTENIEDNKKELVRLMTIKESANSWNVKRLEIEKECPSMFINKSMEINKEIISLMKKNVDYCPELKKPCPVILREKNSQIEKYGKQLEENNEQQKQYLTKLNNYQEKINILGNRPEDVDERYDALETEIKMQEDLVISADKLTIQNESDKKILENFILTREEDKIKTEEERKKIKDKMETPMSDEKISTDIIFCQNDLNSVHGELKDNGIKIGLIEVSIKELEEDKKKLKEVDSKDREIKDKIESLELLKKAFGNNGIKAIVTEYLIPKLEDKINEILSELSSFKVRLSTEKEGLSEGVVIDGLFIDLYNENGEILEYNAYSGGEKNRITVAIFEGLASLQKCNFRIFDESIIGLDDETTNSFTNIMLQLQKNVAQLICVSHLQGVKDIFEEKVEVVKTNGNSIIL